MFLLNPRLPFSRHWLTSPLQSDMNRRAKILFFIEHLCDIAAQKDGHADYIRMIQRDIIRIVDAVAPEDGSSNANIIAAKLVWLPEYLQGVL